jgi:hypothetical protein
MPQTLLEAAVSYAEDGFYVFPLKAGTKRPAVKGYRTIRWSVDQVRDWWQANPDHNIGLCCDLNGLIVVDADLYKPECTWDRDTKITTMAAASARGGLHLYFDADPNLHFTAQLAGHRAVDLKHHGFVALPPSQFEEGEYQWLNELGIEPAPEWLLASQKTAHSDASDDLSQMLAKMDMQAALVSGKDDAYRYIDLIDRSANPASLDREDYFKVVAAMVNAHAGTELEQLARDATAEWVGRWAGSSKGKDADIAAFQKDWDSVKPRPDHGVTIASLRYILDKHHAAPVKQPAPLMTQEEKAGFFKPSHLRPVADRKPRDFLLGKHIRRGFISITSAAGGVGKSSLILREIVSMVTGVKHTHEDVYYPTLKVMMISEDPMADEMEHRLAALVEGDLGLNWAQYENQFQIGRLSAKTRLFAEVDGVVQPTDFYHMLAETEMDVLVIDPLGGVLGLEEDSNTAISAAMTLLADLAQKVGCGIEVVHHSTKDGRKVQNGEDINAAIRGAGALSDRVRSARTIRNMTAKEAEVYGVEDRHDYIAPFYGKTNNAKLGLGGWYVKEIVTNPYVKDGVHQGVTDPVVKPVQLTARDPDHELTNDLPPAVAALVHAPQEEMRKDVQAEGWIGVRIGNALGIDVGQGVKKADLQPAQAEARARVKRAIDALLGTRALVELDATQIVPNDKGKRPPTYLYNGETG